MFDYNNIILFICVFITFILIDLIYFSLIKGIVSETIQKIQKSPLEINIISGFLTYLVMTFALLYFVLLDSKTEKNGILNVNYKKSFILGFVIYAIYDLTSLTFLKDYSLKLAFIDIIWGSFLFGSSSYVTSLLYKKIILK